MTWDIALSYLISAAGAVMLMQPRSRYLAFLSALVVSAAMPWALAAVFVSLQSITGASDVASGYRLAPAVTGGGAGAILAYALIGTAIYCAIESTVVHIARRRQTPHSSSGRIEFEAVKHAPIVLNGQIDPQARPSWWQPAAPSGRGLDAAVVQWQRKQSAPFKRRRQRAP